MFFSFLSLKLYTKLYNKLMYPDVKRYIEFNERTSHTEYREDSQKGHWNRQAATRRVQFG